MLMVTTACGTATAPGSTPIRSTAPAASPIRIVYNGVAGSSDGPLRIHEELIAQGPERIRLEFDSSEMSPMTFVYDGKRLLVHDPEEFRPWILYDAPREHPDQFSMVSHVFSGPGGAEFAKGCHSARIVGHKTILDRAAVGYHCAAQHHADGSSESGGVVWFDGETGLLLRAGPFRVVTIDEHPVVTNATFSTDPPPGAKIEHFAARQAGKAAPDFSLQRVDAPGAVRLAAYRNQPLVLAFFSSDIYFDPHGEECHRCIPALLDMQRLTAGGTDPAVLGVQEGEKGKPGYPLIPHGLLLPVVNDPAFEVEESYGLDNQVAFAFIGSDGRVHRVFNRPPSEAELKAALADLK
jgi:peroxiredoxin